MKTCPRCSFLMGDDESLCSSCTTQPDRSFPIDELTTELGAPAASSGTTLLLDPRTVADPGTRVKYRQQPSGSAWRTVLLAVVVLGVLGTLGWFAVRGDGPLAPVAVSLGLADPPGVEVPERWSTITSDEGRFRATMPAGVVAHEQPVDPDLPDTGSLTGFRVPLGDRAEMLAMSGDLGLGEQLRTLDDPAFDLVVDELVVRLGLGEETVRREGIVSSGRAVDTVLADGEDATTRARFLLDGARVHVLVTRGAEEGTRQLDEAHAKLIAGYTTDP